MTALNHWIYTFLIAIAGFIVGTSVSYEVPTWAVWLHLFGVVLFIIKEFYEFRRKP